MRILIISRYPPFPGGRENFVFELANQLSKNNQVLVITPDQENNNGNLIIRKYPETKELLERIIKNFQPGVINSHTFYLSKDAAEIAKNLNIPFGITLHGDQFAIGDKQRQDMVSTIVNMSNFVTTVSINGKESVIKNVENVERNKIHVINNGVNLETFNIKLRKNNVMYRNEFCIPLEKKIILIPTRLAPYKGLDFLIDSVVGNKMFLEMSNILFLISIPEHSFSEQEKSLFDDLKEKIKQCSISDIIKFVFLKYEEVHKAYSVADLFLLPSEKEQLPMSILEAMACNLPIIATKVGGVPELLEDGKNTYLVDFADNIKLIRCIERCLITENNETNDRKQIDDFSKKYSIEKISTVYQDLYKKYIKQ